MGQRVMNKTSNTSRAFYFWNRLLIIPVVGCLFAQKISRFEAIEVKKSKY